MKVSNIWPRGAVRDEAMYTQLKDYSQIRYGKITPSDIDGFLDFNDKLFVFLELKYIGTELKGGQRLAYQRVCDACQKEGRESLVIVAHHNYPPEQTIPVHEIPVSEIRYRGEWRPTKKPYTVKALIDKFYGLRKNGATL